jgi:neuralized-like protein 4
MFQVLSGCNLFENGKIIVEDYGPNLDELSEGDRVGVMRTSEVCLPSVHVVLNFVLF